MTFVYACWMHHTWDMAQGYFKNVGGWSGTTTTNTSTGTWGQIFTTTNTTTGTFATPLDGIDVLMEAKNHSSVVGDLVVKPSIQYALEPIHV